MAKTSRKPKNIDTTDFKVGQDKPRNMPSTGPARIEAAEIEIVDGPDWKNRAETEAFFEEKIEIMVHPSTDKSAEQVVQVWNNGRSQFFIRGQTNTVRRKFVEVLARAKQTAYTQEEYVDHLGAKAIRNVPHTALRYPFSIVRDTNPKGADWLKKVLAEYA